MKSENILMDEIVKIRRELKRIKKLKKKAKREKKLKKKTKRERVSTKYLTNPEQPKPQPIMVTNPNPQNDNLRQLSSEYLLQGQDLVNARMRARGAIPGNNLVADAGNQLVVRPRPPAIPPAAIPPAPPTPIRILPPLSAFKKKRTKITPAMQYERPQLMKKTLKELKKLLKLRFGKNITDEELDDIHIINKGDKIDFYLDKIKQEDEQHQQYINQQYAVVDDGGGGGAVVNEKKAAKSITPFQDQSASSVIVANDEDDDDDNNVGLDSSQLQNSIFDDNNYDGPNDNNSFMDASLMNAFEDLNNLPPLTFNTPKQVPQFTDQSASSTKMTARVAGSDDGFDFDDDPVVSDINAGMIDMFYTPMSDAVARAKVSMDHHGIKSDKKSKTSAKKAPAKEETDDDTSIPVRVVESGGGAVVVKRGRGRPKKETK